jgi:hypothetical protein
MAEEGNNTAGNASWYQMGYDSMNAGLSSKEANGGMDWGKVLLDGQKTINAFGQVVEKNIADIHAEKMKQVDEFGKTLSQAYVNAEGHLSNLGADSYNQAKTELEELRDQYYEATNNKDTKKQGELMMKLNEIKERHEADGTAAKTLTEMWTGEVVDGVRTEPTASHKAMKQEHLEIMQQYATNPTRKVIYEKDEKGGTVLKYSWIDPKTNKEVKYTNDELEDMVVIKETVNGNKVMTYIRDQKALFDQNGKQIEGHAILREIEKTLPSDAKALRDWTYGDPTEEYVDVHRYLNTTLLSEENLKSLGVPSVNEEGIPNKDFNNDGKITIEDKEAMIQMIMDAKYPSITRSILVDVYADLANHNIHGVNFDASIKPDLNTTMNMPKTGENYRKFFNDMKSGGDKTNIHFQSNQEIQAKYGLSNEDMENGIVVPIYDEKGVDTGRTELFKFDGITRDTSYGGKYSKKSN